MTPAESPFACDMTAIAETQRAGHQANINKLFHAVAAVEEIAHGYKFRFPNTSDILLTAAEFIALERLCCPFFSFRLDIEGENGAAWLSITGREGVKPFILAEIGGHLPTNIQRTDQDTRI